MLLIDRQDAFLKSFYYPNVLNIYDNKLSFENAFSKIKETQHVYKNTLFVMLCGIMSALKQKINKKCHLFLCKEPLYSYSMQDFQAPSLQEHLINEAKVLRKKISTMENCAVIFSGILPPRVDLAEAYEAERHYSQTGHQVKISNSRCKKLYSGLCAGLKEFNRWAKVDAELLGFPNWSLVDAYTAANFGASQNSSQNCKDITEDGNISSNYIKSKSTTADGSTHQHFENFMEDAESAHLRDHCCLSLESPTHTTSSCTLIGDSENSMNLTKNNKSTTESNTSLTPFTHSMEANGITLTMECMLERRLTLEIKVQETFLRAKRVAKKLRSLLLEVKDSETEEMKSLLPEAKNTEAEKLKSLLPEAKKSQVSGYITISFLFITFLNLTVDIAEYLGNLHQYSIFPSY